MSLRSSARVFIPPRAVSGEYVASQLVGWGRSTFNGSTGAWTGPDATAAIRQHWLVARALGLKLRMPPGYFIYTDSLVRTGEAFDGCAFMWTPDRTFLIPKTSGQAVNLRHMNFNGTLASNGVGTASPTYYMTAAALKTSDAIQLNLADFSAGQKLMACDQGHPILAYHRTTAGPTRPQIQWSPNQSPTLEEAGHGCSERRCRPLALARKQKGNTPCEARDSIRP